MNRDDAFKIMRQFAQFAHCDSAVVHGPAANCQYCDALPERQALRVIWGVNFTGEHDPDKTPCPATRTRDVATIHKWPGNRPVPPDEDA